MTAGRRPAAGIERGLWLPPSVLALGLVVLALLVAARWLALRTEIGDAAWVQAVATIESDVAISHLWLEEHVSGDRVDLDDIDARLERAGRLVAALLGDAGGRVEFLELRPIGEAPELAALRQEALRLESSLDQFRQISEDRRLGLERGLAVGIGSSFDVEYDAVFDRLLGHVQVLEAALVDRRAKSRKRDDRAFLLLSSVWTLLIVGVSAFLWQRERRRLVAEHALVRSREQLARVQRTEAVGRLAGGLAHDLDNYLAAIRAQCELAVMKTSPEDPSAVKMHTAIGVVDKASALVDRLLAFHRGAQIASLQPVDLNAALMDLEPLIRSAIGDIELRLDLGRQPWLVSADPVGLEQVVINLVVNARDAMPAGGRLHIETAHQAADPARQGSADHVRLCVRDTGVGIPEAALEKIFEPFWSTKEDGRHSGLGLAIVDRLVHQMGGRISVSSQPGQGTELTVELPRHVAKEPEKPEDPR